MLTEIVILPGEDPLTLGRHNYDAVSPKRHGNVSVMGQGVSDEAIVDVKRVADEGAVMHLRIKLLASDRDVGVEGRNTLTVCPVLQTVDQKQRD